jgi:SAM-dependent methyltransferase
MGGPRTIAAYDEFADWYEDWVTADTGGFMARAGEALRRVLGTGSGPCWDVACGTGAHAGTIRDLGWTPLGTDLSLGQLRHAAHRMPVARADAGRAPLRPGSVPAAVSMCCHTDVDDYGELCRAVAATLAPGGRFAHVGVHPCFVGGFADRSDPERTVISPGYWRRERTFEGWSQSGVRVRVGAVHLPLGDLIGAITAAGLVVDAVVEVGAPIPDVLGVAAHRPHR